MNKKLSKKKLVRLLLLVSLIYLFLQTLLFFLNDKNLSGFFRLEHKNAQGLIDAGTPEKSGLTPVIKIISDNHFWLLRAGVVATLFLAFYYKDKNEDLSSLFTNIGVSVVVILLLASGIITWVLKIIVGKPRPYTELENYSPFSLSTGFHSFPSGHTTETFSYIIPYIYFLRKYYVFVILFLYGIFAAFTRVMLSAHYLTDVLSGIYISTLIGCIVCYIVEHRSWRQRQSHKNSIKRP